MAWEASRCGKGEAAGGGGDECAHITHLFERHILRMQLRVLRRQRVERACRRPVSRDLHRLHRILPQVLRHDQLPLPQQEVEKLPPYHVKGLAEACFLRLIQQVAHPARQHRQRALGDLPLAPLA